MVADTESLPSYEALSYVWGVDPPTVPIICNDIPITIRPNLSHALKRLRLEQTPRVFWADALCINQDGNEKKNCQVPLMSKIYLRADKVCICPGHGEEELISQVLHFVALCAESCTEFAQNHGIVMKIGSDLKNIEVPIAITAKLTPPMEAGLEKLYSSPWFSRVWCIQEVILAKDALVLWGRQELPWNDVGLIASYLFGNLARTIVKRSETNERFGRLRSVSYAATIYKLEYFKHHIPEALMRFRIFESTDPRDKVYGLLGLLDLRPGGFQPDYGKSPGQVFAETATHIVRSSIDLRLFSMVAHYGTYDGDEGYASWAPRWDTRVSASVFPSQPPIFSACGKRRFCLSNERGLEEGRLCCTGVIYDKVSAVDGCLDWYRPTIESEGHAFLRMQKKVLKSGRNIQCLARTMTVGYTHSRHHIGDVDEETQTMYYRGFNELTTWSQNPVETIEEDVLHAYHDAVYSATRNRRIFWTLGGSHGLGPLCMRQDDIVVVLYGYEYPLVLRTRGDGYLILGEEYIDEIMRGELVEEMEQGRRQEQIFCLI